MGCTSQPSATALADFPSSKISLGAFTFSFGENLFLLPLFSSGGFMVTPYTIASNSASSA
jgi:hypothetical protein